MTKFVTCNKCGWVHIAYTRKHAEAEVKAANDIFDSLTQEQQQDWYGGRKATIAMYDRCVNCGGRYTNFRPSKEGDCPDGCTISGIIHFKE